MTDPQMIWPEDAVSGDGAERMLVLRLFSADRIVLHRDEVLRLLLHRFMLTADAVVLAVMLALNLGGHRGAIAADLHVACGIVTVAAMVAVLLAYLRARISTGAVDISLTPGLLLAVVAGMTVSHWLHRVLGLTSGWSPLQAGLMFVFYAVLVELGATLASQTIVPAALERMRRQRRAVRSVPPTAVPDEVLAGGKRLDVAAVLHLEACGNYVQVMTDGGRTLVPGPFSAIVAQMPDHLGRRVHRSHWVADRAVQGFRGTSRDLRLLLIGGGEVPVAIPRQAELVPWLARLRGRSE